jgi:hypothetical protein
VPKSPHRGPRQQQLSHQHPPQPRQIPRSRRPRETHMDRGGRGRRHQHRRATRNDLPPCGCTEEPRAEIPVITKVNTTTKQLKEI